MARVYIDSCIMIYAAEKPPGQGVAARRLVLEAVRSHEPCISGLVRLECRVKPLRLRDDQLLNRLDAIFRRIQLLPLDADVCDLAAELRAVHDLKTPDALHVACAITHGCDEFWTNDDRLLKLSGRIKTRRI